jgi:predicted permease
VLNVFLNVLLPTFLVASAGAGLQRWRRLPAGPLSQLMLYLLSPALVLDSLLNMDLPAGVSGRLAGATVLIGLILLVAGTLLSHLLGHDRRMQSGFLLATAFPNAGNMALPISLLAFGEPGLAVAVITFVVQAILGWSLGVFVAARSNSVGLAPLKKTLRLPIVWAIAIALLMRALDIGLPEPIAQPVHMLAQASIPLMLLILGFQLEQGVALERWPSLALALGMRLLLSALIAYFLSLLVGLQGVAQQTFILVAAMPTAVFTTILAIEFDAEPRFVTSAVITSTVLSLLTLTPLIALLQSLLG